MSNKEACEICGNISIGKMNGIYPYCSPSCMTTLIWKYIKKRKTKEELFLYKKNFSKKYEKSFLGYLMRKYRNMKSRIAGVQKKKHHLYRGLEILPIDEFYIWSICSPEYELLFEKYKESGFDRKLAPSIDRIDSKKGYVIDNMRWITHSENSRNGSLSQKNMGVGIWKRLKR